MPTVTYDNLPDFLKGAKVDTWPAVTLIFGEEMLCKTARDQAIHLLVDEADRSVGVETFDGSQDNIADALASLATYALLSPKKLVVLQDARIFYSSRAQQGLREKMEKAASGGEMKKAARPFLSLLAICGLRLEDMDSPAGRGKVVEDVEEEPPSWFSELLDYCRENRLTVPVGGDDASLVTSAMEKGFPQGHRLLIVTDIVDRRKALFKAIGQTGVVVDCSVPAGETRSDRMARDAVMNATIDGALKKADKRLSADARRRIMSWTGFDLRTLSGNMDKLIQYVGDRKTISDDDVTFLLSRTRKDPIFEFTNAVGDRDLSACLFFLKSLTGDGMHPLQLLSAVANQIRRLIVAKDFLLRNPDLHWSPQISFPQFKTGIFPKIQKDDGLFGNLLESWEGLLQPVGNGTARKKKPASDLVLARNPKSPFPVFQALKKADYFSRETLISAMVHLGEIDRRMKSTGQDPLMLLENFLLGFCRQSAAPMGSAFPPTR